MSTVKVKSEDIPFHVPTAFKIGDDVKLAKKVTKAYAWYAKWVPSLDKFVGKTVKVVQVDAMDGFYVNIPGVGSAWLPSCALAELPRSAVIEIPTGTGKTKTTSPKVAGTKAPAAVAKNKKKVRVQKAGPWDVAPCTHLKWHLMGFFKEKLTMTVVKTSNADGTPAQSGGGVGEAEVSFICVKCDKSVTLKAQLIQERK